ncbi:hypothetical protein BDR07DRAFT_1438827 [Suillus spraguei]|nr:hypothetical protein BDR07DRAFT_1438827 [Suillus spraguei]
MKASADSDAQNFLLLTVFMKLCLIRGLVAAVKLSFASEDMNYGTSAQRKKLPYRKLRSIVFSDSVHFCLCRSTSRNQNLERLAAGDWTVLDCKRGPEDQAYNVFQPHYLKPR